MSSKKLLPGQVITNGTSNYIWGTNNPDYSNAFQTTPGIQTQLAANNITVIRMAITDGSGNNLSLAAIDAQITAIQNVGAQPLVILRYSDQPFDKQVVTHLGANCNMYELSNEPDLTGISVSQYLAVWNSIVPACRAINNNAAFIGPVLGAFSNMNSYMKPFLQGCVTSGVIPDGVSWHDYPCTSSSAIPQATCAARAPNIGADGATLRAMVKSILGVDKPICLTEWNIDAFYGDSRHQSYSPNTSGNASFISTFTDNAIDGFVANGVDMACEFEINAYLVDDASPSTSEPQLSEMEVKYQQYIGGGGGGSITLTPTGFSYTGTQGGANPAPQTSTLTNHSGSSSSYGNTINYTQGFGAWLSVTPGVGTLANSASAVQTLSVNLAGLTVGTYAANIVFTLGSFTAVATVTLVVNSGGGGGGNSSSNPYGYCIFDRRTTGDPLIPQILSDMVKQGASWLRYQLPWHYIDPLANGNYTTGANLQLAAMDDVVARCNKAGINIMLCIQEPPGDNQLGTGYYTQHVTEYGTSTYYLPDASKTAAFALFLAKRYNGGALGTVNALDIWNEDADLFGNPTGVRDVGGKYLANALVALYSNVKAANPSCLVVAGALLMQDTTHITNWLTLLNTGSGLSNCDAVNFHFYKGGGTYPIGKPPLGPGSGNVGYDLYWQTIAAALVSLGHANKPVWNTEYGYSVPSTGPGGGPGNVDEKHQWQYMQMELDSARLSGVVTEVFWFTIGNDVPLSITQHGKVDGQLETYRLAFGKFSSYIAQFPQWGTSGSGGGSAYKAAVLADITPGSVYHRLGEASGPSAKDVSGSGFTGTYSTTGVTYAQAGLLAGDPNTSVLFDGNTGMVTCASGVDTTGWTAITLEAWFELSNLTFAQSAPLFANDVTANDNGGCSLNIAAGGTSAVLHVGNGSTNVALAFTFAFVANTRYYIAATYDGATAAMYLNPTTTTPAATASFSGAIGAPSQLMAIGGNLANGNNFPGVEDETVIYKNLALSGTRVLAHYNAGITASAPVLSVTPSPLAPGVSGVTQVGSTYTAVVTLSEASFSVGTANWSTSTTLSGVTFSPSSGALTPGTSVTVTISGIPNTNGTLTFSGAEGETPVIVGWTAAAVITNGGFALFANGAGVASFDHFRVTGYPDPSLALAPCGRLGSSVVNWNANEPEATSLTVDTSLDGLAWTNVLNPGDPIPGLVAQPDLFADTFTTINTAAYTSTFQSGGSLASWTFDPVNVRLEVIGGATALLLINSVTGVTDVSMFVDMDYADGGGMVFRCVDTSNLYALVIHDASASNANNLTLIKIASGTPTTLATGAISFNRNTYHHIALTMIGNVITAFFDGTQILTYTDSSPLGAGQCGLRNSVSGGFSTAQYYQLNVQSLGQVVGFDDYVYTRHTLNSTDPNQTIQVLDSATLATGPSIGLGATIPGVTYQNTFCNANFDDLKKQSDYIQYIDSSRQMVFTPRSANPAPWILQATDADNSNILVQNLKVEYSGDLYRNRQKLLNVQAVETFTKQFTGDGTSTSWTLDFPVANGTVPIILLSGVSSVTVGIQGQATGQQYYYTPGGTDISQDASQGVLNGLQTLTVTWQGTFTTDLTIDNTGQFPGTTSQQQYAQIQAGGGPITTTGIVEDVFDLSQQLYTANMDVPTAINYANQLLQEFGVIGRTVTFRTMKAGLAAGMVQASFIPQHLMQNVQLLLTNVSTSAQNGGSDGGPIFWYDCTAVEGAALGDWIKAVGSGSVFG